ncbi:MAG: hypothetical protein ABEH80_03745, partial [Halobaculum sp.]
GGESGGSTPDGDGIGPERVTGGSGWGPVVALVVLGLLALGIAYLIRPFLHGIVMGVYTTPELVFAVVAAAITYRVVAQRASTEDALRVTATVGVVVLFAATALGGVYSTAALGQVTMDTSAERAALPEIDADHPRIVPKAVADRYASNSLQTSRFKAVGGDVTVLNGTTYWSYALAPDGTRNRLLDQQSGTVLVDMEQKGKSVRIVDGDLQAGIGMAITDSYTWKLHTSGPYLVDYHEPFMVVHEGEQYIAVPYTKPVFDFRIPVPFTRPTWGGVALIDSDGTVRHLSPQEAQNEPVLSEQRLYPFDLAREQVAATRYRNGIVNTLPVVGAHEEEIELAPLPGEGNEQPFLTRTEEGLTYFLAAEPYGETQGLREVWVVDPRTGGFERFGTQAGSTLLGPRKSADFVRQAARTTDWDRFTPSEPIPAVVDGTLYWELRVVPTDASGISYVAFVNAQSSDVLEAETTQQVKQILRGKTGAAVDRDRQDDDGTDREPKLVIVKRNADGEVIDRIVVYENESVTIQTGNETAGPR